MECLFSIEIKTKDIKTTSIKGIYYREHKIENYIYIKNTTIIIRNYDVLSKNSCSIDRETGFIREVIFDNNLKNSKLLISIYYNHST